MVSVRLLQLIWRLIKMNKKGFTTIELITSFTLASIIMIILFNIILIMKDNLSKVNAMTNTLI